jgi:predicted transcriptional regulator of viral defense system
MKVKRASDYLVQLLKEGRHTFTRPDAENALAKKGMNLYMSLRRLQKSHWLASPVDGFYVIVGPEYQGYGIIPPEWIIEDLANYLSVDYYVSTLSAAMFHSASHQKPQRFQTVVSRQIRRTDRGGYHMDFFRKKTISNFAYEKMKCPAGYFRVSTPEVTAYDLLFYRSACPSLDLAATVFVELGAKVRPDRLKALVDQGCETATLQRVGWLLDATGWQTKTDLLAKRLVSDGCSWRNLRPTIDSQGKRNGRWRVVENAKIEPDIGKRP